ncbi:MAG: SpoIIE family protein phosphatase, partial [Bacteroidota bacterium]
FIIYRPKDVVSGDFYWVKEIGNTTLLATVDCTGHGVPGAFMSLIGKSLLDLIIESHNEKINPAYILQQLHHNLKETLHASNEKVYGMDLSFVKIEQDLNHNSKITFAGAKSSMYYIEKNKQEVVEVKGDRKSIGGIYHEKALFNNQEYTLPQNSIFYLTSDGYQDQNNQNRERLGKKRLKNILLEASQKPIDEQKPFLEATLKSHMKNTEQRDDIMLMGVQV